MSFGDSEPQRTVQTTQQAQTFPEELKPYISDILTRGQTRMQDREAEGYQPYTGPRLAEFTPEMVQAREGLTGLVNQGLSSDAGLSSALPYFGKAQTLADRAGQEWNTETANQYMSPYMQSVVDLEKREAERVGDVQAQQIGDAAVKSGGFGGSRQAIREAEQARNENQLQADIQTKGSQAAYESGLAGFQSQKARDALLASQMQSMGSQAYNQAVTEQGQLSKVGEQGQGQDQRSLDLEYQKFLDEKTAPDRALQDYSGLVRGYYMAPDTGSTQVTQKPAAALGTQLMGAAATGAGIYGNLFGGKAEGGSLNDWGISSLRAGGTIKLDNGGGLNDPYADYNDPGQDDTAEEGDFTTLTAEDKAGAVKAGEIAASKGYDKKTAQKEYIAAVKANKASRITDAAQNAKDVKRAKWLELAKFGTNLMKSGAEGKGILSAVGDAGASSLEGLQAIDKGEKAFGTAQKAAELNDLKTMAGIERQTNESDRQYELALMDSLSKQATAAAKLKAAGMIDDWPTQAAYMASMQAYLGAEAGSNTDARKAYADAQREVWEAVSNGNGSDYGVKANGSAQGMIMAIEDILVKKGFKSKYGDSSGEVNPASPSSGETSTPKKPLTAAEIRKRNLEIKKNLTRG